MEVVVLIAVLKGKGLGRLAQADAEQALSEACRAYIAQFGAEK